MSRCPVVVLATSLSLSACGLEQNLVLDLPQLSDAESMIVAVESSGTLHVYAEDLGAATAHTLPIALPADADARIDILTYSVNLAEMEIDPGELVPVESDPRRPLPMPSNHFVSYVERGVAGGTELGERDESLSEFRIAGTEPEPPTSCIEFTSDPLNLVGQREDVGFQGFEIAVSSTVVLVGTPNEELFEVTLEGAHRINVEPANVAITAGARDERGGLWFGDREGSLWRGRLGLGLTLDLVATSTMGGIDVLAVGEIAGGAVEAFAVANPGTLTHFDGAAWRGLHSMCLTSLCTEKYGYRLERLGPGEVVAMRFKATKMIHHRDGRSVELSIPHTDLDSFHARCIEKIDGFGVVVGIEGQLLGFDPSDDTWEDGLVVLPAFDVYSVVPFEGGLVFGGDVGAVTSFVPGGPPCPVAFAAGTAVIRLVPLAGALLAIGQRSFGGTNTLPLTVLRPE